ncbi:DUF4349 domain-containing protein [Streptomyces fradiae]|uniref:DUF4349 domain-containing protein n=1 Tax=Streptomyces fradiae TaxID=1906 RepID=UPI003691FC42
MPITTRPRHALAAVLLGASLALAGCAGSGGSGPEASADRAAAPEAGSGARGPQPGYGGAAASPAPGGAEGAKPGAVRQHVIRTTELSVEVEDADEALARARRIAAEAGGHVADESTRRRAGDGGGLTSRVTLRVPQAAYEGVVAELAGAGRLLSRRAEAKDVTEQVVDVESRIATQRASVARVRALMERAEQLSDVVTLERELSSRQADLESLLAQQASLKDRTALATVTLELSEPAAKAAEDGGPGVLDALRGGWSALLTSLTWLVLVLAALAPWLPLPVLGYVVWRRVLRPWRERRRARAQRRPAPGRWPSAGHPQGHRPAGTPVYPQYGPVPRQGRPDAEKAAKGYGVPGGPGARVPHEGHGAPRGAVARDGAGVPGAAAASGPSGAPEAVGGSGSPEPSRGSTRTGAAGDPPASGKPEAAGSPGGSGSSGEPAGAGAADSGTSGSAEAAGTGGEPEVTGQAGRAVDGGDGGESGESGAPAEGRG